MLRQHHPVQKRGGQSWPQVCLDLKPMVSLPEAPLTPHRGLFKRVAYHIGGETTPEGAPQEQTSRNLSIHTTLELGVVWCHRGSNPCRCRRGADQQRQLIAPQLFEKSKKEKSDGWDDDSTNDNESI